LRPDWDPGDPELIRQCEDLKRGPEILFRKLILPHLRDTYHDLLAAVTEPDTISGRSADLMIAGELVYAAPLTAEKLHLNWASAILSPTSFFSAHDPSLLVNIPAAYRLRRAGWPVNRALLNFGRLVSRHWWNCVRDLRRELGLNPQCDPVFRDKFSPHLVLALFSHTLAQPQPDWPPSVVQPGFVFHERETTPLPPELIAFLASGEAPIVFTLGSTAVHNPGNFYQASLEAVRRLRRRAILVGVKPGVLPANALNSPDILTLPYVPYSQLFPHAAVTVHQGGSGTTGQAMRAGRPMLFVPYGWDQPDNAARVERLGCALSIARAQYTVESAAAALARLLSEPHFALRAAQIAADLEQEDGLAGACNAIESIL
jgi:UDP:flavonoid glycosyltransferase YjiC (YdhE family)